MSNPLPPKIIFVFSLPRSGSTWLQRELCRHPAIASSPEPWIALPLIYLNRVENTFTPYSSFIYNRARLEMLQRGCDYSKYFNEASRKAMCAVYTELAGGANYFLDKTPRYAHIATELVELFPDANFIFLWRDPIDIGLSILRSWGGRWDTLFRYEIDFEDGLIGMINASKILGTRAIHIHYEDLRENPNQQKEYLFRALGFDRFGERERRESEISAMLESDLIGDQSYKDGRQVAAPFTHGNRRSLQKLLRRIPSAFWELGPYKLEISQKRLKEMPAKISPINSLISYVAAQLYRANLYGVTRVINHRRDQELGRINKMLD